MPRTLIACLVAALAVAPAAQAWSWPTGGRCSGRSCSARIHAAPGQHRGIDVGGAEGEAVHAPAAGVVSFAGTVPAGGRTLTIRTADGYAVTLLHLGSIGVARGAAVGEGDGRRHRRLERRARGRHAVRASRRSASPTSRRATSTRSRSCRRAVAVTPPPPVEPPPPTDPPPVADPVPPVGEPVPPAPEPVPSAAEPVLPRRPAERRRPAPAPVVPAAPAARSGHRPGRASSPATAGGRPRRRRPRAGSRS